MKKFQSKKAERDLKTLIADPFSEDSDMTSEGILADSDNTVRDALTNNIEFDRRFRGYDCGQVDDYIAQLTAEYNAICERCAELERENKGLRKALAAIDRESGDTYGTNYTYDTKGLPIHDYYPAGSYGTYYYPTTGMPTSTTYGDML